MGKKSRPQIVKSRGERTHAGLTIKEWQRTPKQLLQELCQRSKRPRVIYKPAGCREPDKFRCRIVLPDPKGKREHDIVLATDQSYDTKVEAEHAAALLMLHKIDGARQHEKKLPEPYASAWLSLCGRAATASTSNRKEVAQFKCEHCGKEFKKDFALAGHVKREHADILAKLALEQEDDGAGATDIKGSAASENEKTQTHEGFDLYGNELPGKTPKPSSSKGKGTIEISSSIRYATKHEKMQAERARLEERRKKSRLRDMHKMSNPYASVFMSDHNRALVETLVKEHAPKHKSSDVQSNVLDTTVNSVVKMGFTIENVQMAVDACGSTVQKDILDWLMLHLDEEQLPAEFDPRGKQFEVVKASRKHHLVAPLRKALFHMNIEIGLSTALTAKQDNNDIRLLEEFIHSYPVVLEQLRDEPPVLWPLRKDAKSLAAHQQDIKNDILETEFMVLDSIFENGEVKKQVSEHSFNGFVLDQYLLQMGSLGGNVPGDTDVYVVMVMASDKCLVYPEQPALVMIKNSLLSEAQLLHVSIDVTKYVAENLRGEPQIFEIWEYVRVKLEETCGKNAATKTISSLFRSVNLDRNSTVKHSGKASSLKVTEVKSSRKNAHIRKNNMRKGNMREEEKQKLSQELLTEKESKQSNAEFVKMQTYRKKLPAGKRKEEVLRAISNNQVVLISGETGCGKTTQIPQFVLDEYIYKGKGGECQIICTQPRRLAAIGVATRVSNEQGDASIGDSVGYQIRLEAKVSKKTRLIFVTTGILLRRLQSDPELVGVSHIIVDEVHERNVDSDFLLSILRHVLIRRPDLKLILMSATMDADVFARYYSTKSIIKIPGFTHPVQDHFLGDIINMTQYRPPENRIARYLNKNDDEDMNDAKSMKRAIISCLDGDGIEYDLISRLVLAIHSQNAKETDGAILIFLSGVNEIRKCVNSIEAIAASCNESSLYVLPLHGALTGAEQSRVFLSPPKGKRKVVVSTNVAETSLTIDDIVFVIDSGRIKETRYDAINRMSMLVETWVSRNSAKQRRGRAGRVRPGHCYKMYTRKRHDQLFDQAQTPEIKRVPLESLVLQILSQNLSDTPHMFMTTLIEPPERSAVTAAINLLQDVDALTVVKGIKKVVKCECTGLGYHLAKLPMDVRVGKMLIYGALLRCGDQMLTIAAALSVRNPFMSPMDKREEANEAKARLLGDEGVEITQSDHICLLYAYEKWNQQRSERAKRDFATEYYISHQSMTEIRKLRRDFAQTMKEIGFSDVSIRATLRADGKVLSGESVRLIKAAVCAGLYPNVINVLKPVQKYTETSGGAMAANPKAKELKMFIREAEQETKINDTNLQALSRSNKQEPDDKNKRHVQKRRVFIHPSSINFHQRNYACPWMVYREKVLTSKLFIRDCTVIPPYCLMFFGGKIDIQHERGTVTVDDWIVLKSQARIGVLIRELKKLVDAQLLSKINNPDIDLSKSQVLDVMRKLVIGSGYK